MENRFIMIILLVLAILFFTILLSSNKKIKEFKARSILYILLTGLLTGIIGLISFPNSIVKSDTFLFCCFLVWMLGIGILHAFLSSKILPWLSKQEFWSGLLLALSIACLGGIFLLLSFHLTGHKTFQTIHLTALLIFVFSYLFFATYVSYLNIPVKILRKWYYPVDRHVEDPLDREMESPHIIAFDFKKKASDENMTSFRAKAPKEMVFGKLFYYFINDYNDRNPDGKIEFLDENKKPYEWIFYFKPKWFSSIRYLDPEETNSFNFIRENSIIICKRVIEK
jgi:hypothetical protein